MKQGYTNHRNLLTSPLPQEISWEPIIEQRQTHRSLGALIKEGLGFRVQVSMKLEPQGPNREAV